MNIPGMGLINKAQQEGNEVKVPMTGRMGLVTFVKQVFKEAGEDHLGAFAGNVTYSALFAIFPFLLFLLSLLGLFGHASDLPKILGNLKGALPGPAYDLIATQILKIVSSRAKAAFGVGAVISILAALWGVQGGFQAIMEAMNVMYEVPEGRPIWKKYLIAIGMSIIAALLLISSFVLVTFGGTIAKAIAAASPVFGNVFVIAWEVLQWPVLLLFVLLAFALIYYAAPDVKQKFQLITIGSVTATVLWALFSLVFSFYVNHSKSYQATYGTFVGLVLLLLYIHWSAYILLLGAEMNQVIETHTPIRQPLPYTLPQQRNAEPSRMQSP